MQRIFGSSVDAIVRHWRVGTIRPDTAMERIYLLLPLGDREEYIDILAGTNREAQAIAERDILVRRARDIVAGKEV